MALLGAAIILTASQETALVFLASILFVMFIICDAFTRGYAVPALDRLIDGAERSGKCPSKASSSSARSSSSSA